MQKTILYVDDNDDIRAAAVSLLETNGFRVIAGTNGREAVELVEKHEPDMILLDLAMPVFDGIDAARQIRMRPRSKDTPLVAVTSYGLTRRPAGLKAGFDEVIEKGDFIQDVMKTIRKYLPE